MVQGSGFKAAGGGFVYVPSVLRYAPGSDCVALNIPLGQWHTVEVLELQRQFVGMQWERPEDD